jgi:tetratricopeptide (TPR) repeat protein
MKHLLPFVLFTFFLHAQEHEALPEFNYDQGTFDSTACCWRKLSAEGKHHEAAELIVNYIEHSPNVENKHSLNWHAGQAFAMAGDNKQAVKYFKKTYSLFYKWLGGEDGKAWYYFAKGTTAFIKRDKPKLESIIAHWKKKLPLDNNYKELTRLLENWEKGYEEATGK